MKLRKCIPLTLHSDAANALKFILFILNKIYSSKNFWGEIPIKPKCFLILFTYFDTVANNVLSSHGHILRVAIMSSLTIVLWFLLRFTSYIICEKIRFFLDFFFKFSRTKYVARGTYLPSKKKIFINIMSFRKL